MSETLKKARQQAGITVTQLASKANVSRTTLEKAEKGRGKDAIRYEYASRIVNALNALANTNYTVEQLELVISER